MEGRDRQLFHGVGGILGKDVIHSWNSCRFVIRKRMQRDSRRGNANTVVGGGGEYNRKIGIYK